MDPTATTPTQRVVIVAVRTDEKLLEVRAIDVTRVGATATKAIGDEAKAKMGESRSTKFFAGANPDMG